jgi:tRNA threonylcarbamoyladenosine biosynthesis protein TsaB
MVTLAIDTSHAVGSTALARDGGVLGEKRFDQPSSHLVELSRSVEALLADHALTPRDIDRVAVVLGPGSFTGVRIGLAFAKGLAAAGTEVVGMSSLELLARPFFDEGRVRVCAMIDAKREEVFAAVFEPAAALHAGGKSIVRESVAARAESPTAFLDALDAAPDVFAGTGAIHHRNLIAARFPQTEVAGEARALPSIAYLATLAHLLAPYGRDTISTLEPIYVRPSGAERMRLRSHRRPPE